MKEQAKLLQQGMTHMQQARDHLEKAQEILRQAAKSDGSEILMIVSAQLLATTVCVGAGMDETVARVSDALKDVVIAAQKGEIRP